MSDRLREAAVLGSRFAAGVILISSMAAFVLCMASGGLAMLKEIPVPLACVAGLFFLVVGLWGGMYLCAAALMFALGVGIEEIEDERVPSAWYPTLWGLREAPV